MKKTVVASLILTLAMFFCVSAAPADNPPPQTVTETIELFDGQSLAGWYTFIKDRGVHSDPKGVFTVADGMIHITGEEFGCITTDKAYQNYKITVEFKWGDKRWAPREDRTRDSGLLIHSIGEDGAFGATWMCSIETNIIEGGMGDFIVVGDGSEDFSLTAETAPEKSKMGCYIWQKGGEAQTILSGRIDWYGRDPNWSDTADFRGQNDLDKPHGEWNTLEVVADGDTIDVYFNGVLVNQAIHVTPSGGKIQIQSESAEIFVRRVTLSPLAR